MKVYYTIKDEDNRAWYHCRICHKKYKHPTSVYSHAKFECSNKFPQFQCMMCGRRFRLKGNLKLHMANIHDILN